MTSWAPVREPLYTTDVRPELLRRWVEAGHDPDKRVVQWCTDGAPAGVRHHPEHVGVFPLVPAENPQVDPEHLVTDFLG